MGALAALVVRASRQRTRLMEQIVAEKENELLYAPEDALPVPQLIPLDELPPLPGAPGGERHEP